MQVSIHRLSDDARLPVHATAGAAGWDLFARLDSDTVIAPGERKLIPTGIAIALPSSDVAAMIFPRSGLANRSGIALSNCVGVVDSDYRGEIKVSLINHSEVPFTVHSGDRIAQLVVMPVISPEWVECEVLEDTERGAGGYGSTGI